MTMKIICTTQQFRGYLMAKDLKVVKFKDELSIFLLQKGVLNFLIFSIMTSG